jgi:hypothetical protein
MDDMYHNCKWCRNYRNGRCIKSSEVFESPVNKELYNMVESGKLSEAITEGIKLPEKMSRLERLLAGYGISHKRQEEILQMVGAELEEYLPTMVECIDRSVGDLLINTEFNLEDLELTDPKGFCCKYFV